MKIGTTTIITVLGLAAVTGWTTVRFGSWTSDNIGWLLVVMSVGVLLPLVAGLYPVASVLAIIGLAFVNSSLLPPVIEVGQLSFRLMDVAILVCGAEVFLRTMLTRRSAELSRLRGVVLPIVPFLLWIGVSLINVWLSRPQLLDVAATSYLRLLTGVLVALLFYLSVSSRQRIEMFGAGLLTCGMITVAVAVFEAVSGYRVPIGFPEVGQSVWTTRYGGLIGIDTIGLVSGLLVVYALIRRDEGRAPWSGLVVLLWGAVGLFLAKSAMSIIAAMVTTAFYLGVVQPATRPARARVLKASVVTATMGALGGVALWLGRPGDMQGLLTLAEGSFAQRVMIAYAGLQIFLDNPVVGVGWQMSGTESVIGASSLNERLMRSFPLFPGDYYFVTRQTSLHNMYLQFLAELGLIGMLLFAVGSFFSGKAIVREVRSHPPGTKSWATARTYALGLVYLLVWWNGHALFGGQPEGLLAFVFLAGLARLRSFRQPTTVRADAGVALRTRGPGVVTAPSPGIVREMRL